LNHGKKKWKNMGKNIHMSKSVNPDFTMDKWMKDIEIWMKL